MRTLLIVHHPLTGGSLQVARAAAAGAACEPDVRVHLEAVTESGPQSFLESDGYRFACPESLASVPGLMKHFFDRCDYEVLGRIEGRPCVEPGNRIRWVWRFF